MSAKDVGMGSGLAVFAGISMVVALVPWMGAAPDTSYAACWIAALLLAVPFLHVMPGRLGHGLRALGLVGGVLGLVALFALWSLDRELTATWWFECGTGAVGLVFVPFIAAPAVAAGQGVVLLLRALPGHRWLLGAAALTAVPLALSLTLALALCTRLDTPEALLVREVRPLAPLPRLDTLTDEPVVLGGSRLRSARGAGPLEIDGHVPDTLPIHADYELAEGLGYRFLRRVADREAPEHWLAWRPGDEYPVQVHAAQLGRSLAPPGGFAAAFLACAALALAYALAALDRARELFRLRGARRVEIVARGTLRIGTTVAACDPLLAPGPAMLFGAAPDVGTYRTRAPVQGTVLTGERAALVEQQAAQLTEHCAMVVALVALGATPLLLALAQGRL